MNCTRLARPMGWNLGRVSLGARVAGAHLAASRVDASDAGAGLVPGVIPWRAVEFLVAAASQRCAGWVDDFGGGVVEPQVYGFAGNEAFLGPAAERW